jgi:hypothetical protein
MPLFVALEKGENNSTFTGRRIHDPRFVGGSTRIAYYLIGMSGHGFEAFQPLHYFLDKVVGDHHSHGEFTSKA